MKTGLTFTYGILLSAMLVPHVVFADIDFASFKTVADDIIRIIGIIVPVLITLALIAFLWGVVKFIAQADSPDGRAQGRIFILYGLISLFVIVSIWGILSLAESTLFSSSGGGDPYTASGAGQEPQGEVIVGDLEFPGQTDMGTV